MEDCRGGNFGSGDNFMGGSVMDIEQYNPKKSPKYSNFIYRFLKKNKKIIPHRGIPVIEKFDTLVSGVSDGMTVTDGLPVLPSVFYPMAR